jgi:hypothetical protein
VLDQPVKVINDVDQSVCIEPYMELSRVYRRMFKHDQERTGGFPPIRPESIKSNGFILAGLFSSYSANEKEDELELIDGIQNVARTGQIIIHRYSHTAGADVNVNTVADREAFTFINYSCIFDMNQNGNIQVIS